MVFIDSILTKAYDIGMVQDSYEIRSLLTFLQQKKVRSFVEIGTSHGGSFYAFSAICKPGGHKVSVDLCGGAYGQPYDVAYRNALLSKLCKGARFVMADSHDPSTPARVSEILGDARVDFLFIDADHTYNGVSSDYNMYRSFVKPGGWIGFHDIKQSAFHESLGVGVGKFWESLAGHKMQFIGTEHEGCGVGLIQNE
jgi:cephalosporin hydroxylase